MFFVTGKSRKKIAAERLSQSCWECEFPNAVELTIYQKYRHLYWLPIFPRGKEYETQCSRCGDEVIWEEIPEDIALKTYDFQNKINRTPPWVYSGIYVFIALVISVWYLVSADNQKDIDLLKNPKLGDVYDIRKNGGYSFCVVADIKKDTVFLRYATKSVEKWYQTESLKEEKDILYSTQIKKSITELIKMEEDFEISSVNRH
jgi:hypothetical protein